MSKLQLFEKYRPKTWAEVVGQTKVLNRLETERKHRGTLGGQAYSIYGRPGTGKTSISRLIALEVAGNDLGIDEKVPKTADDAWFDWTEKCYRYRPIGADGWAFIINEIHRLAPSQIERLLDLLEPRGGLPEYVVWIFTTTVVGQEKLFDAKDDASTLGSRTVQLTLSQREWARACAEKLHAVATAEGLNGQPLERYVRLVNECGGNMRDCYQYIGSGKMLEGSDK